MGIIHTFQPNVSFLFWHDHHKTAYHHARLILHYNDVTMGAIASQITSLTIIYSTVYSDADQRKHQSSASLALVRGIHRWPVNSSHKWPVTRKMFPFDDVIMDCLICLWVAMASPFLHSRTILSTCVAQCRPSVCHLVWSSTHVILIAND